jgi:hypothetical protein
MIQDIVIEDGGKNGASVGTQLFESTTFSVSLTI